MRRQREREVNVKIDVWLGLHPPSNKERIFCSMSLTLLTIVFALPDHHLE